MPEDSRPVPDPTFLTTENLLREIGHAKELIFLKITLEAALVKQRQDLEDKFRLEQKADAERALEAALSAQKEAVEKQTIASERFGIDQGRRQGSQGLFTAAAVVIGMVVGIITAAAATGIFNR